MRVLHLSSEKSWRGGERQIAFLIEEHKKMGIDTHIICKRNSSFSRFCKNKNWQFQEASFSGVFDLSTPLIIKNYCKRKKIDLIHLHTSKSHTAGVLSALFGNATNMVLTRRVVFEPKNSSLTKWKYNHSQIKKVVCISKCVREVMSKYLSDQSKCLIVYSAIDTSQSIDKGAFDIRKQYNIKEGTKLIGTVGALSKEKDHKTFINTASILYSKFGPKVKFLVIGDGVEMKNLKDYAEQKGLSSAIIFTGFLNNVLGALSELDYFLFTSKSEGLGTSILDAMLCRVPVVSTNAGAISEIVIHGETGLLSPITDSKSLATNIESLITDGEQRSSLIENAYRKVKHFDKQKMASQIKEVYEQL